MDHEVRHLNACPDPARWLAVAAGVDGPERSAELIDHAAHCDACACRLRESIRLMADEGDATEDAFVAELASSQSDWQRRLAQELAGGRAPRQAPWWNRRTTWAVAAALVGVVASVAILGRRPAVPAATAQRPAEIAAVVLSPITTRDLGNVPLLKMTPATESADITLQFVDTPPRELSVGVRDDAERLVWEARLDLGDADTRTEVTVTVPAKMLPAGNYHIRAGAVTPASGKYVSYVFRATY
jgi:hypothetical protein